METQNFEDKLLLKENVCFAYMHNGVFDDDVKSKMPELADENCQHRGRRRGDRNFVPLKPCLLLCLHRPLLAKLVWFTCPLPSPTLSLICLFPQLLQGNSSPAGPRVLGRGHSLRHLRGGGQTAQQRVAHTVDGGPPRSRGKHRPVPHAKHNQTPRLYFMLVLCIAPKLMTTLLSEEMG